MRALTTLYRFTGISALTQRRAISLQQLNFLYFGSVSRDLHDLDFDPMTSIRDVRRAISVQ